MKALKICIILSLSMGIHAAPPFGGTIFVESDIINDSDPSTFISMHYQGQGQRIMFDRRTASFNEYTAYLFDVVYSDRAYVEFQVNSEFLFAEAEEEALNYANAIGQIPAALKANIATVWIHKGDYAFGGGNNNILIHTGSIAEDYIERGILAETLVHESTHTSIDPFHQNNSAWILAQENDMAFISTYAESNPTREDLAESLLMYLAVTYRSHRISATNKEIIENTIPNRINYFANQNLDFSLLRYTQDTVFLNGFDYRN